MTWCLCLNPFLVNTTHTLLQQHIYTIHGLLPKMNLPGTNTHRAMDSVNHTPAAASSSSSHYHPIKRLSTHSPSRRIAPNVDPIVSRRTQSSMEEDPERLRPQREPTPLPPEANAPPPAEEVTALRMGAHYGGLVLASMIGTLIRLGLDGLATCTFGKPPFLSSSSVIRCLMNDA
jgi:hypothetical protein